MNLTKLWIVFNTCIFTGIGLLTFLKPTFVSEGIGYKFIGPVAYPEFLASYGGLLLAIGILLALSMYKCDLLIPLFGLFVMYGCYVLGRVVGLLTTRQFDTTSLIYITFEISSCVISIALFSNVSRLR